jgi:NAD(P)-dependent dehydrogenase (short-subunit alcohol dehydrogenase family)
MTGQVQGKVALVTGGASGIGEAVCELLARGGASVAVTDVDDLKGPEVVARIKKAGGEASFLHHDVTSEERWIEVVAEVMKRHGRLDVLVSNAGIGISVPSITEMSLADWRRQTAINLDGVFLSVKHCLPVMRKTGGGSVIMMSSLAGLRGAANLSGYCATKGGVRLFAKAIAMECAAFGDGIRVNSVHPGIIDTPIWGKIPTGATGAGQNADRSRGTRETGSAARPRRPSRGNRAGRALSCVRRFALYDRDRARHRRWNVCGRRGAEGVSGFAVIARSEATKQSISPLVAAWIASRSLSSLRERNCARRWARIRATRWLAMTAVTATRPAATEPAPSARRSRPRAIAPSWSDNPSPPSWCRCRRGRRCRQCRSRLWSIASAVPALRRA